MRGKRSSHRAASEAPVANPHQNPSHIDAVIEPERGLRGKLNRRSVRVAYKALMAGLDHIPSEEDIFSERTRREWIWEYVLHHCPNVALIKALVEAYPIPNSSLRLKRMLLLKSLSIDVSEDVISERTLEAVSCLTELNRSDGRADEFLMSHVGSSKHIPGRKEGGSSNETLDSRSVCLSLKDLHVAVKVECTIQHLREEADDWPKFYEALETHWGDYIQDTEEQDDEGNSTVKLDLRKELWNVQKQPELRHPLLQKYRRPFVKRMLRSFLADAWRGLGPSFLEGVVDNLSKGLYVPLGQIDVLNKRPTAKKTSKGSSDGIRTGLLASETLGEQNQEQKQQKKKSSSVSHSEGEKSLGQVNRPEKVQESMQTARGNNLISASTDVQLLAGTEPRQSLSTTPPTGQMIENRNSLLMDEEEGPMAGETNEDGNHLHAGRIVSNTEKASDNEHKNETLPTREGDISAEARSKCDLLPQEEERSCPSPPPWTGSPSLLSGGLAVTSRSKRRKLAASFLDDMDSSKLVLNSGLVQGNAGIDTPEILKAQSELRNGQAQLNKAVTDPLPEALKIAEEAAKTIDTHLPNLNPSEEKLPENGSEQGNTSIISNKQTTMARLLPPQIGGSGIRQKERREQIKGSLMDRNPTAQTFEWETNDKITDNSDANSLSSSRQVRLPSLKTRRRVSLSGGRVALSGLRRKRSQWTQEEEDILRKEVER